MSSKAAKLVPIAVVGGAMGYFCWSHLDELGAPPLPAKPAAPKAELTAAMLSPPPAPDLVRNPFEAHREVAAHDPVAAQKPTDKPPAAPVAAKPAREKAPVGLQQNSKLAAGLVLNGTYASGKRRMAIINGSLYAEGETIRGGSGSSAAISVARVDADKVVLSLPGEMAEVSYVTPVPRDVRDNKQIRVAASPTASPATAIADGQPAEGATSPSNESPVVDAASDPPAGEPATTGPAATADSSTVHSENRSDQSSE